MLEITAEDIRNLDDSDLRLLIGLLCEAELRIKKIPAAGVKYGGDQRSADGGIDVKVELETPLHKDGYIPKSITGFQVKTPDMPRKAIISEMKPSGRVRDSIKELADSNGAYIIVSSNGSTSDSVLKNRKEAMREALSELENSDNLKTDFYDRTRIASWVRNHPSLILWVRQKIGRSIQGWKSYENWSNASGGTEEEYILDDQVRLYEGISTSVDSGLKGVEMINKLRSRLSHPQRSIRLTGLSGVGKTRLVQALFDERIGENPLNQAKVFYTDVGDNPSPDPQRMAEQIISMRTRAILIIDNCSPETHRQLNSICTSSESLISLITIEYDVREDQPEETEIFRLEPASSDLIEKMVKQRFKYVSQVDVRTITEFSGGNARIAIALSGTVEKGKSLGDLKSEEIFKRLFYQRNDPDNLLLRVAEVCSLVYSFDSRHAREEMQVLSSLIGITEVDLHRHVAELKRRQLVQQRNYWKAVLPHAIANRLAKRALENIPKEIILETFEKPENERLLISFSRRLSYLHDSEIAVQIVEKWLSEDGFLNDLANLNSIDLLKNIAPVKPEATLSAIEHAAEAKTGGDFTSRENRNYVDITRLLCSLAYDPELFERSVDLLIRFFLSEREYENVNSIRSQLKSLFMIYLSGTHATAEQRLYIIQKLILSNSEKASNLGFELLRSALKTSHFTSFNQFEFGARSRDTGFWPKRREDFIEWFSLFINFIVEISVSEQPISEKAKLLLAESFRGLWTNIQLYDELEIAAQQLIKQGSWKEGWVGVRKTLRYDKENLSDEALTRLKLLSEKLKPSSLLDQARLYALSKHGSFLELADTVDEKKIENESDRYRLIGEVAKNIGKEVAQNEEILSIMLPELVQAEGAFSFAFGQGLAEGISDSEKFWERYKDLLASTAESDRRFQILNGFLYQLFEDGPNVANKLLDAAVSDAVLGAVFPYLQTAVKIDASSMKRLFLSLDLEIAPIYLMKQLAYGGVTKSIDEDSLSDLLLAIAEKEGGIPVAIEIFHMRLFGVKQEKKEPTQELILVGRKLLENIKFDKNNNIRSEDHILSEIIKICYKESDAEQTAKSFCNRLATSIAEFNSSTADYSSVCEALIQVQPKIFLDSFYGENNSYQTPIFFWNSEFRSHPLSILDQNIVIEWCGENPTIHYPIMARAIVPYEKEKGSENYKWTPLANQMITNSPEPEKILNNFMYNLYPSSWSGSRAAILQTRLPLISELKNHEIPAVADWAFSAEIAFGKEITEERKSEDEREKARQAEYGFE